MGEKAASDVGMGANSSIILQLLSITVCTLHFTLNINAKKKEEKN